MNNNMCVNNVTKVVYWELLKVYFELTCEVFRLTPVVSVEDDSIIDLLEQQNEILCTLQLSSPPHSNMRFDFDESLVYAFMLGYCR